MTDEGGEDETPLQVNLNGVATIVDTIFGFDCAVSSREGDQSFPSPYIFVDVKDVANAHIQALELPSASGRYYLVGSVRISTETLKILRQLCPTLQLPTK
ncbi:hypothetical protein LWI29_004730 [Acer saccharum]|uniref:Uncharacterized protein n=1 Tax=Acer saccharum TaxID=4024 RepID=A0AA39W5J3_ACESA|nr:hypothetical protein LWI29_004730 [Acer saccharum]